MCYVKFCFSKEKLLRKIAIFLLVVFVKEGNQDSISSHELEQQFHCLRRLVASKAGFSCFTSLSGFRYSGLQRGFFVTQQIMSKKSENRKKDE